MDMPLHIIRHCNCNKSALINGLVSSQPLLFVTSRVSYQKGPTCHAYTWQRGPFWQDSIDISYRISVIVFIWDQFWPLGIVVACVCVSIPLCVNHELVYKMTHDLFKLGSPKFGGQLTLTFIVKFQFSLIINFKFICMTTHHLFKLRSPNLDQQCKITCLRSLLFCGADCQTASQSWPFHSLNPLFIYWSRQPRVI